MKYAILADIHANLAALQAVLVDAKSQGCARYACLGDIVGGGTNPKECLDIIRSMNVPCVKGNFDEYCCTNEPLDGFNPHAAEMVEWTRHQLTLKDQRWLVSLPYIQTVAGFIIVHGTLDGPQRWGYVFDKLAAAASFSYQKAPVCFFGHTHIPVAFRRDKVVRGGSYSSFKVERGKQYFVNPGAVGQPPDNNPKAAYATYDLDSRIIESRRVAFNSPPGDSGSAPVVTGPTPPKPVARKTEEASHTS